ncbi:MAG: protein kinase, partial [Lentisphaerae bacterium]|nr:protein kinase [Lentisphaerota bacterium]
MHDFDTILTEQFSFVKALKQKENKKLIVLRHNVTGNKVVKLTFDGEDLVYRILQAFSHPNLPEIFSVSQDESECTVIEEYIDGITVADVLQGGLYNEKGARAVASGVCCALDALHKKNIIHRDIKPENVMLD